MLLLKTFYALTQIVSRLLVERSFVQLPNVANLGVHFIVKAQTAQRHLRWHDNTSLA